MDGGGEKKIESKQRMENERVERVGWFGAIWSSLTKEVEFHLSIDACCEFRCVLYRTAQRSTASESIITTAEPKIAPARTDARPYNTLLQHRC